MLSISRLATNLVVMIKSFDKSERTVIHDRVNEARTGKNPYVICKLETCWVTVASKPLLPGHCVTFADPVVFSLNDLSEEMRMRYSRDVCRVGDALIKVTGSYRINYETLCNVAQALHSHITPRQISEPEAKRRERAAVAYTELDFDLEKEKAFIEAMKAALKPYSV